MIYDMIVLGTGGVGSAAMYHLAKRGVHVLGLDRFPPGHDRGSSHGESRVIRRSYFEHPSYVPLLNSAYELWNDLGLTAGKQLLHQNGILYFATPGGPVIQGIRSSSREHGLTIDELTLTQAADMFPQFVAPPETAALFEPDGGFLLVEECVKAHIAEAIKLGAKHRHSETIASWAATESGVTVRTKNNEYRAAKLVIAAGAWTNDLLTSLSIPLRVVRKHQHWYTIENSRLQAGNGCPCYFFEAKGGYFYGCPGIGGLGLKVAEHSGGIEINDPLNDSKEADDLDLTRIQDFTSKHIQGVSSRQQTIKTCFYTMTPDENFIVDRHPEHSSVVFAAGLSGHGFKFASALGNVLAELSMNESPTCNIEFLNLKRESLWTVP